MSKKITLAADGQTATVGDAKIADIFTTMLSTDSTVTGMYGLIQRAGLFAGGMLLQNYRVTGSISL